MKRPWDPVKLTVLFWHGNKPVVGDELQTRTGRRYLIQKVGAKVLECVVLPKDAPHTEGTVFAWEWGKREKKREVA